MKDVVFLVIDSWMHNHVFASKGGNALTPFLDSIKDECIVANNVYAQGPFTEAGTKGLLTGRDTLDEEGYFLRYHKSKSFITNIFKDAGFETYSLIYPTCLYSDWIFEKLDHVIYTSGMFFDVFWEQKFLHYIDFYRNNKFDDRDMSDCIELFDVIFTAWLNFMNPENEESRELLAAFDNDYDYAGYYKILKQQQEIFNLDPKAFVENYLKTAPEHPLNKIKAQFTDNFICSEQIKAAFDVHKKFQKQLSKKQFFGNLKNNRLTFKNICDMVKRLRHGIGRYTFGEAVYWSKTLTRGKDIKTYINNKDYKTLLSGRTQMEYVGKILSTKTDSPKFVTAHIEEPHYFTTFFSFDSADEELIGQELDYAQEYVESLGKDYKGLISYDLSIRYIDKQLERLVKCLEENGRLDDTIICITADHGSSYNCYPYRQRIVNNCHTENFHIPFIIYEKGRKGRAIEYMATSKDLIPTVLDYIGSDIPSQVKGKSLLGNSWSNDYAMTEYMGPGCPDMRRNNVCITIRNLRYVISYEGMLKNGFSEDNIKEVYCLENDPLEIKNKNTLRNDEINAMISALEKRFNEIVENNREWVFCDVKAR